MFGQGEAYHLGYEITKAYQAERRAEVAHDRLTRQARTVGPSGGPARLRALLGDARLRRWMLQLRPITAPGAPRDRPTALP